MSAHAPRPGDLPKAELVKLAAEVLAEHAAAGIPIELHFKVTCEACGERVVVAEPNRTYDRVECAKCGHETPFTHGGFMFILLAPKSAEEGAEGGAR